MERWESLSDPLLRIDLEAGYGNQRILAGIHLELQDGERMGLVGTSGAGKSTLVLAMMGLLGWRRGWSTGQVLLEGKNLLSMRERDVRELRGRRIAVVPQSPMNSLNGMVSLRTHFNEAWRAHESSGADRLEQRLRELMRQVHLSSEESFLARRPGEISVGQAQRVVIALALLHRPKVLIADEPISALDPTTQAEILEVLRTANHQDGTALLYISHDLLSVLQLCESMAVLHEGTIVECMPISEVSCGVHHPVTMKLLQTLPAPPEVLRQYSHRWQREERFSDGEG